MQEVALPLRESGGESSDAASPSVVPKAGKQRLGERDRVEPQDPFHKGVEAATGLGRGGSDSEQRGNSVSWGSCGDGGCGGERERAKERQRIRVSGGGQSGSPFDEVRNRRRRRGRAGGRTECVGEEGDAWIG